MNIQGVEILTQKIIYSPEWFGIIAFILFLFTTFVLIAMWADGFIKKDIGIISCFTFSLFILCLILTTATEYETVLNHATKIQYEIEVLDDNAWKELGPNYTVKEKIYSNKEIYLIEGDYVE